MTPSYMEEIFKISWHMPSAYIICLLYQVLILEVKFKYSPSAYVYYQSITCSKYI
jgi:hypothetical protein